MMLKTKNIFILLFLLIPFFLITGPAIPDIIISLGVIIGIILVSVKREILLEIINNNITKISLAFWFILIFISFFAFDKNKSFQDSIIFLRFLLIPIFCYFIFFKNDKIINYLLIIIFVLVLFVSVDTLIQFFNYSSRDGFGNDLLGFKSNWYGRLTGPFKDELIPGSYLSKFGLFGYIYLISSKKFERNILIQSFYLSLILIVCFATGERMALAVYSLALVILLFFIQKHKTSIILSMIFGLISIYCIFKFHPFYNDYEIIESTPYHQGLVVEKIFECNEGDTKQCSKVINLQPKFIEILRDFGSSAYGEIYSLSYNMFKDNPITGIGISNFNSLCNKKKEYKDMMVNYNCSSHPHNTYIQWITEGGMITFIFFILYIITICNTIVRNNGERNNKIISLVIIIILFWPFMSTGSLTNNWYGVIVFYIIGICLCVSRFKKNF